METSIKNYITRTATTGWMPLVEEGVNTSGIYVKPLRYNAEQKRSPSILLKFEAGAAYPFHNHPAGEELFVLQGSCMVNETELMAGDYLYTPPGFSHAVTSATGCELMLIIPEEVEILAG